MEVHVLPDVGELLGEPPARTARPLLPGVVTRSDAAGVWVTGHGADQRSPIGPCKGATYRQVDSCPAGQHGHALRQLPQGTEVLYINTVRGPWVVRFDEGSIG